MSKMAVTVRRLPLVNGVLLPVYGNQMLLVGPICQLSQLCERSRCPCGSNFVVKTEIYVLLFKRLLDFVNDPQGNSSRRARSSVIKVENEKRSGLRFGK